MTDPAPAIQENDVPAVETPAELPGHKVFAGNLAYSTTDEGLKAFFSPVANDIVSTQVIFRGPRSAGYGFVAFKSAEAAQNAVDLLNKKELDGRTLIVEVAKPPEEKQKEKKEKKAFKKRTSKKVKPAANAVKDAVTNGVEETAAAVTEKPADTADETAKPKKKRNQRKTKKVKAAATTDNAAPLEGDAAAASSESKPKKPKTPRLPRLPRPAGEAPAGEPSKTMLFVANLGFSVDDAALSELFTSAGVNVTSARVVRRRWGTPRRSKGYGFVDVGSEDEQKKALELLQGKEISGREIAVKIAVNAQEKEAEEADEEAAHAEAA